MKQTLLKRLKSPIQRDARSLGPSPHNVGVRQPQTQLRDVQTVPPLLVTPKCSSGFRNA